MTSRTTILYFPVSARSPFPVVGCFDFESFRFEIFNQQIAQIPVVIDHERVSIGTVMPCLLRENSAFLSLKGGKLFPFRACSPAHHVTNPADPVLRIVKRNPDRLYVKALFQFQSKRFSAIEISRFCRFLGMGLPTCGR
jgi:hypothetical protein